VQQRFAVRELARIDTRQEVTINFVPPKAMGTTMSTTPETRTKWFWINLGAICALAPAATYWFQQHTIWALVRLIWGLVENATQFDAWDASRQLLSSFVVTRWLVVAILLFAVLWWTTGSLYLELAGNKGGEYQVEVVRKTDGSPVLASATLSAGQAVIGKPTFWHWRATALQCRILRPIEYEPLDCEVAPRKSTRIAVPGDFQPKEFHLLRLVPVGSLYRTLAHDSDQLTARYDLEIKQGNTVVRLKDLRRQTVYMGAREDEMPLVMHLEEPQNYEHYLDTRLRAAGQDRDSASLTAAILSSSTRMWPALYLKAGDELSVSVVWSHTEGERTENGVVEQFPISYRVTSDKVQTLWLPKP